MSEPIKNANPNPTPDGNQGTVNDKQNGAKGDNLLVRGFKKVKQVVSDGWKEIKSHPVTHGLAALGGTALGGFITYKAMSAAMPAAPEIPSIPQMPEPERTDEDESKENTVEYVDIPQPSTTVTEEQ